MEYQTLMSLLATTSTKYNNVPRFISKKRIEIHDQSCSAVDRFKANKQIRLKTSKNQIYVTTEIDILFLKELLLLQIQIIMHMIRN